MTTLCTDDDLDYVAQALSTARHHSAVRVLEAGVSHLPSIPTPTAGIDLS